MSYDSATINDPRKHLNTPMGIHRLLREPYDDREIFTNVANLVTYCKSGAFYDGQRVSLMIGDKSMADMHMINFTMRVKSDCNSAYPIMDHECGRLHVEKIGSNYYVLVYHYNPVSGAMFDAGRKTLDYREEGMQYSILELLNLFDLSTNNTHSFYYKYGNPDRASFTALSTASEASMVFDPITNRGKGNLILNFTSGASATIIPSSKGDYIQWLYIQADDYVKLAGGVF